MCCTGLGDPARGAAQGRSVGGEGRVSHNWSEHTSWGPVRGLPPTHSDAEVHRASLTQTRWGREDGRPGIPFLASNSSFWSWPQGVGVGLGRGEGTLEVFCFYKWELLKAAFFRHLSSAP